MITSEMGSPWKAVADDNRRQILILLKDKELTPSEIHSSFGFTLPAVSTHLRILKDAGLVSERKEGKNRYYSVNRDAVSQMLPFFDLFWEGKLLSLKNYVETKKSKPTTRGGK